MTSAGVIGYPRGASRTGQAGATQLKNPRDAGATQYPRDAGATQVKTRETRVLPNVLGAFAGIVCLVLALGCSSIVTPKIVRDQTASFDGNIANSGFLKFNDDGSGLITARARDRYNALIERYGGRFDPPLKKDAGVRAAAEGQDAHQGGQDGRETLEGRATYVIDAEHLVKFATMNRWKKSGDGGAQDAR